jgi:hypothetical protein
MSSLRTSEGSKKYQEYLQNETSENICPLCDKESLKDFPFWKLVENSFPYDQIAKIHHMLVSARHVSEEELTGEELEELSMIKKTFINSEYDWIIEPTYKNKSIPGHFHLHLIVGKS